MDITNIRKYTNETQDVLLRFLCGFYRRPVRSEGFAVLLIVEGSWQKMKILHLVPQVILLSAAFGSSADSATCLAPPRPFVPSDPVAAGQYEYLIRQDFETYIRDIQRYFQCLDEERARAFEEARAVSQDYGSFLREVGGE